MIRRILGVVIFTVLAYLFLAFCCLLSSCLVTGRSVYVSTPRLELYADTATAMSWPYNTRYQ